LRHQNIADPFVTDAKIKLPLGVARIGFRQPLCNGEAIAVGLERAGEIALRDLHVADLVVGHR
jgi:hypothetical protein